MKLIKCDSQIYEVCPFHYACGKGEDYAEESECDKFAEMALKRIVTDKDRRAADIISALQDENAKLRAELEKVRVERDALKIYFNDLSSKPDCNTCARKYCEYKPRAGQTVRANCPLWRGPQKEARE